jgi:hypothetical protein
VHGDSAFQQLTANRALRRLFTGSTSRCKLDTAVRIVNEPQRRGRTTSSADIVEERRVRTEHVSGRVRVQRLPFTASTRAFFGTEIDSVT